MLRRRSARPKGSRVQRPREAGPKRPWLSSRSVAIFTIYLLLSTGLASAAAQIFHAHSTASHPHVRVHRKKIHRRVARPQPPAKYLVLIVLDGARPDYFGLTALPHVDALRAHGTQFTNAIDGILESETPAGHATISTGTSPAHNGILGFDWTKSDNDYSIFSPAVFRAGIVEHIMQVAHVPTIAGLYKARYPTAKVVALSAHKYYAADPLGGPDADAIMYFQGDYRGRYVPVAIPDHMPPVGVLEAKGLTGDNGKLPLGGEDHLATKLALVAFAHMHQRITLINYPEFDWPLGHVDGGELSRKRVAAAMKAFDRDLGLIESTYRKAGILRQTLFVITADHGMAPVYRYVPRSVISRAVARAGTTAPAITAATAIYVWLRKPSRAWSVADNIMAERDPGIESTYYLSTEGGKPHYIRSAASPPNRALDAANRYLLDTLLNGHEPAVVAFCKPGNSGAEPTTKWRGDHGGADWPSQHIPLIMSGPRIRAGVTSKAPAQLEDVAPTALAAMGVPATGMEGNLLTEALKKSTAAARDSRKGEVTLITPVVGALKKDTRTRR